MSLDAAARHCRSIGSSMHSRLWPKLPLLLLWRRPHRQERLVPAVLERNASHRDHLSCGRHRQPADRHGLKPFEVSVARYHHPDVARAHNARHRHDSDFQCVSARVCPEALQETANLSPKFDKGDGLKTPCSGRKKSAIGQVLACRILTVCGEVAERLKAAVC